ncbi:MAG: hypothetical protein ACKVW3_14890 [Phycisphaerales bacterium]
MDKTLDCVELKRQGAEHVRRLTQGMDRAQLLRFWADRTRELEERRRRALEDQKRSA